ncbi:hypothetical protein [Corynebacterium phocae]|uniref:hypothetical protein n=1 Tax=Corynebacterium phocae TaxID=161895 RepID=UPI0009528107|nr:hypothetical protein [Corynebacterium phocae]
MGLTADKTGELPLVGGAGRNKPHLDILVSAFGDLLMVSYRNGKEFVEFDPPPGTRGHKRYQAMQSSSFKRVTFPILAGVSKASWAILVFVVGPLVAKFLAWLAQFLPEINWPQIPWPDLPDLPDFPQLRHVTVPVPHVDIPWPDLPDINLPELPEWLVLMIDYRKMWVPIVLGIIFGIMAVRNHRRSERQRASWAESQRSVAPAQREERCDPPKRIPRSHSQERE